MGSSSAYLEAADAEVSDLGPSILVQQNILGLWEKQQQAKIEDDAHTLITHVPA